MRKKFFLFIIAAFMATSPAWAGGTPVDSVPMPTFLSNIQYDLNTGILSFVDNFEVGTTAERRYDIVVYYRNENTHLYSYNYQGYTHYEYGDYSQLPNGPTGKSLIYKATAMYIAFDSQGGNMSSANNLTAFKTVKTLLDSCYSKGYTELRLVIEAKYKALRGTYIFYTSNAIDDEEKRFMNNYVDITLPYVATTLSAPSEVKYGGDPMVIKSTIQAAGKCKYYIQESNDGGASWTTQKSGALTAVQAREGAEVSYQRVLTGNHDKSIQFRTRVVSFEAPYGWIHSDTTEVKTVRALYPCTYYDQNGTLRWTEWHTAGEEVVYMKPADCRDYRYTSELPVKVEEKEAYLSMTMPACPVRIKEYTPTYQVNFYDADATLLKTEEVAAGEDATPPAIGAQNAPAANHAPQAKKGTFTGWSKDYTNVHKPLKVFAKYDVYVDMDIDVVSHTCNRTEDWNFMSWRFIEFEDNKTMAMAGDNLTFRASVKTNTPVNVYFQSSQ